jgi:ABC-type branched-subunit amino acid transport system substrate-binding protein
VKSALLDIMKASPQAVVTVGPYKPIAAFIKTAREVELDAVFVAISFVGSNSLAEELGDKGKGVIISQVVPLPWDTSLPLVAAYQAALAALDAKSQPGFVSLEGYMVGRVVVEGLKRIPGEPTRETLIEAIARAPIDLGGITLSYGPDRNQGSDAVFFTILTANGSFKAVTHLTKLADR